MKKYCLTEAVQPQQDKSSLKETAGNVLQQISGYIGTKVMNIGIDHDIFNVIDRHDGLNLSQLAKELDYDEELLQVWADSAYAHEFVQIDENQEISLNPHLSNLLLNNEFPMYLGGLPGLFTKKDMFDNFEKNIQTGNRTWWDQVSNEWIEQVSETTYPNYTRMIQSGFDRIPELSEKLENGAKVLEMACGTSRGLIEIAKAYPQSEFSGLDGDKYSLQVSQENVENSSVNDDINFIHDTFEDMDIKSEYDVIFINASMHECRDMDTATANIYNALKDDGIFVIADLPFPENKDEYMKLPNKIMLGINFFEIQIDDLLLPTSFYTNLLENHGFHKIGNFNLTDVHSVIYGYK